MTTTARRINATTQIGVVAMTVLDCPNCGVLFGIEEAYEARRRYDGRSFHCPSGHTMSYEAEETRLRKRLERAEQEANAAGARARRADERAEEVERSRRAVVGHLTRAKKRIANGVCPACNRQFQDLHRHMKGQHPDYATSEVEQ